MKRWKILLMDTAIGLFFGAIVAFNGGSSADVILGTWLGVLFSIASDIRDRTPPMVSVTLGRPSPTRHGDLP